MATTTEPLSNGLVTAKDPSLLAPGELQQTDDLFYKPASPSLHKAPGRNKFNSTPLPSQATGLQMCGFDGADDQLVALSAGTLYKAKVDETGNFTTLATGIGGSSLEAVHYNNHHVLLTGSGTNNVLLSNGTTRQHGMQPVTASPAITVTTSGGTWPLGTGSVPNFYEYWTTEVYKSGTEDIESTFTGTPETAFISTLAYYVTINRPPLVNQSATHWRVYRSIAKAASSVAFPNGFLIGEVEISANAFNDGLATVGSKTFPTATNDAQPSGVGVISYSPWTNSSNLMASDANYATGSSTLSTITQGGVTRVFSDNRLYTIASGYAFGTIGSPISDITVEVKGYHGAVSGLIGIALSWDGGVTYTGEHSVYLGTNSGSPVTATITGLWGRSWSSADFGTSLFRVRVTAYNTKEATVSHNVDYVAVTVTHGGTTGYQITAFRDIQISLGGVATRIGAAGPPPTATTGDIFQDSLVLNDVANPTQVKYSMPGDIDAYPAVYLLKLDTKDKDTVTNIKSLGSVCLVGLASQVWRVNYLPREEDAEFDRGRCIEVVDTDHGMVGTHAACKFTLSGQTMVGYVSSSGLRMTNGFQSYTMTDDVDWESLVNLSYLSRFILVNDAKYHHLRLYYVPTGSTVLSRCLLLSYYPSHLKDGKLKVSGPAHVNVLAATTGVTGAEKIMFTSDDQVNVFVENRGSTDHSGVGIFPILRTREMYQAGPGNEWQLQQVFVHHQSTGGGTYDISYEVAKTNTDVRSTLPKPFTLIRRGLSNISSYESGEGITIKVAGRDDGLPASFDYLVIEGTGMGTADPLTR